jgi:hypothetical protein
MKRTMLATIVVAGALLAPAAAAAPATQDSVTGSGSAGFSILDSYGFEIDAHSGPSGQFPGGFAQISPVLFGTLRGPVSCLAVEGNAGTLNFVVTDGQESHVLTFTVTDLPAGDQIASGADARTASDCAPLSSSGAPVTSGDLVVVDALPPPTTYTQCRQAGWVKYGFAGHADCIDYVHDQARQKCIFERVAHGIAAFRAKYGLGPTHDHAMRHCVRLYTGF